MSEVEPKITPLVTGLTRPVTMLGVPIEAFIVNLTITMSVFVITKNLLTGLIAIPIHLALFAKISSEARWLEIWQVKLAKTKPTLNRGFWGANSYGP